MHASASLSRVLDRPKWDYARRTAVLATKHHKLDQIAPAMATLLSLKVIDMAIDTDQLGTFAGDIPRTLAPFDCAVAKARLAMEEMNCDLGLASEGTIGAHPQSPWLTTDRELVVLVDDRLGHIYSAIAESTNVVAVKATVGRDVDIRDLARQGDLPRHGLIVRPAETALAGSQAVTMPLFKGVRTADELRTAIDACCASSSNALALVMTDFRAHCCPSRQAVIAAAAQQLAERVRACCDQCGAPGFGTVRTIQGLPCTQCGFIVPVVRAEIDRCWACAHEVTRMNADAHGDPSMCERCNP